MPDTNRNLCAVELSALGLLSNPTSARARNESEAKMSATPQFPSIERRAYTIAEFCHAFSIGRTKCNELMHADLLVTRSVGRRVLIDAASADRWYSSLPSNKRAAA